MDNNGGDDLEEEDDLDATIRRNAATVATNGNKSALNGDYLQAIQCYTEAIAKYPTEFGFFLNRSLCYIKIECFNLALLDANEAVKLSDQNAKCYYIRSYVLKKLNEFDLAEYDLQIASDLQPDCEDIHEEIARLKGINDREALMFKEKLNNYDLNDKTYYKIKVNFHLIQASDLPSNIWNYQGVRVENIRSDVSMTLIHDYFSLFGNIKDVKRIYPRSMDNPNVMVYYYNPVTPMFTIAYYQNKIIKELCAFNYYQALDKRQKPFKSYTPLALYFAPTDSQIDLKFSRPKHPLSNSQECYYWRTTSCQLNEKCPKLHIPANKNIDTQIWMMKRC